MMKAGFLAAAMLAAFTVGTAAQAETAFGGSISLSAATDYSSQIGYLSKFNPLAGTLTGVTFTVGYGFDSLITVNASSPSTGSVFTTSAAAFNSSDAGIAGILNANVNRTSAAFGSSTLDPAAYNLNGTRSVYTLDPGSRTFTSTANASNTYTLTGNDFAAFYASAGSSAFDVFGQTLTGLNLQASGGNASATQSTRATQSISVLYTYATGAVPEPASWATMLVGFGVIGAATRRRRRTIAIA